MAPQRAGNDMFIVQGLAGNTYILDAQGSNTLSSIRRSSV